MNNLVLVGRLVKRPVLEETENGRKTTTIVLAVSRNFKNDVGEYETDFIPVNLVGQVAESTVEYCKQGDVIGVKGRLARLSGNDLQVVAEKISFLSSRPKDYDKENDSQIIVD